VVNGVNYLTSGAGAEPVEVSPITGTRFRHRGLGFMNARLGRDEMAIEFFDAGAKPLHRANIAQRLK
jgi:hypothetical protein